jgi:hypothetical protein
VDHESIDVDMRAARYRPGRTEESNIDERIFGQLGRAHDRAAEEVAHHHIDADRGGARHQDENCEFRKEIFRAGEPTGELAKSAHPVINWQPRFTFLKGGSRVCRVSQLPLSRNRSIAESRPSLQP